MPLQPSALRGSTSVTISNRELQSDLREIAAQIGGRSGLSAPSSEDDLRNTVIKRAAEDGITLRLEEVTVRRTETEGNWAVFLSADYDVTIGLPGFAHSVHFSESASHQ